MEVVLRGKTYKLYGRVGLMVAWLTQNQGRLNDISPLQLTFHSGGPKSKTVTAKLLQEDEVGEEILDKGC